MSGQRPHARRTSGGTSKASTTPGWVWMVGGLLLGLFVAFLLYLYQQQGQRRGGNTQTKPVAQAEKKLTNAAPPPVETKKPGRSGIEFDFYKILPEMEVVIPRFDDNGKVESTPPNTALPAATEGGKYVLQVGSFRREADAETRKAHLLLLNFLPKVQTITIDGEQTWHRVQLGPYTDMRELDRARNRLQDNNIDFIAVRIRD